MRLRRIVGVVGAVVLSVGGLAVLPTFLTSAVANPSSGPVFSWGGNIDGELGVGENTGPQTCATTFGGPCSKAPVQVSLPAGVTAVANAAGWGDSLAVGSDGNAYAWGFNNNGQLGNGTTTTTSTPTRVSLPSGVTAAAVAAGEFHSLVIGSDGHVYAFGANSEGELGNGTTTGSPTPVRVALPAGVTATAIAAGTVSSFALGSDGRLYTWGEWGSGQQRCDPQQIACYTGPVVVPLPSGVTATTIVGSDYLGLALGSDHHLYQIDGTTTPTTVSLPAGVTPTQIASGNADFYAAGSDGHLYAWGGNNSSGQFGNGTMTTSSTPVQVSLPSGVSPVSFAATTYSAYAIGSDGHLYAWGDNAAGQLGIGNDTGPQTVCGYACSLAPVQVSMPAGQQPVQLGALGQDLYSGYVITAAAAPPSISGTPPSPVNANTLYAFAFSLSGSPSPTTTVTAGSLPPALPCPHPA
jgi:alpha-tubulin suppressor-like RCC1 family protein